MRAEYKFNMREHSFVVILILWCFGLVLTDSSDNCHDVEVRIANKQLLFPFKWDTFKWLKSVVCDKYGTTIGQCRGISVFDCSVEQPFSGLYTMSSNANLTEVTLTFKIFEENLAGNYCCSKESKKEPTCQCIQKAEPLTPKPVPHTEASTGTGNTALTRLWLNKC
ncbi:uncharacterized protein LOC127836545 [Dreissena polymorpha]|uniref:uncharacterized protein LOC127836545 n=1 Tax=Dreissena polymorpha TaxID=45954 RepID=UPI0022644DB3|nr:uncharacterized protein LOC127836545 [Dreissena polymorpha]